MNLTLRQLRYFLALAEQGHFTRAAEMMHVTQPALSMQIRALEDEVGNPVVERTPSGVVLTPQGRALELHARRVMAAMAGLDQASGQELDKALYFDAPFREALEAGQIPQARLDDMVRRFLIGLIDAGVLDAPVVTEPQPIDYAANAEVAQRAAEAGIVLLKNEGGVLPLAANARTIALIGGHADVGVLSGGGSFHCISQQEPA